MLANIQCTSSWTFKFLQSAERGKNPFNDWDKRACVRFLANELMLVAPTNRRPAVYQSFISRSHHTRATDSAGILSWAKDNNPMSVFAKIKTDLQIFVRTTNIRCLQNSSTGPVVERCGRTDRHSIPLTMRSGLYMSLKGHVGLRLFRHFECSMGGICDVPLPKTSVQILVSLRTP